MNKKHIRVSALAAGAALLLQLLSGCGAPTTATYQAAPPDDTLQAAPDSGAVEGELHLAVVLGNHSNAPQPNIALIEDDLYAACRSFGSVTFVCDDGDPYAVTVDIPEQEEGLSNAKYQRIASEQTEQLMAAAAGMTARTAQVDTLKAVQLGARAVTAAESRTGAPLVRRMVLLDSCLTTTGALSLVGSSLSAIPAQETASKLLELGEIPDLSCLSTPVAIYGLGDTAAPQVDLPAQDREGLAALWIAIFHAGGAEAEVKDDLPLSTVPEEGALPEVSTVTVVRSAVDVTSADQAAGLLEAGAVMSFDETSIAFSPGTADFLDTDAAGEALAYVSDYMTAHPEFRLLVCGTTACWGGEDYCRTLSRQRAEAVCGLLGRQVDPGRLTAVGLGYGWAPFYTDDQRADGTLDPEAAARNRSVKLLSLDAPTAQAILAAQ